MGVYVVPSGSVLSFHVAAAATASAPYLGPLALRPAAAGNVAAADAYDTPVPIVEAEALEPRVPVPSAAVPYVFDPEVLAKVASIKASSVMPSSLV